MESDKLAYYRTTASPSIAGFGVVTIQLAQIVAGHIELSPFGSRGAECKKHQRQNYCSLEKTIPAHHQI